MSELVLSIAGFATILGILFVLSKKLVAPYVAIAGIPIITCILIGHGANLNTYITKGIGSISTTGVMFIFSVMFFGIMSEAGAFDPFVTGIIKATRGDPVRLMLGVFFFAAIVHLDGSGVVTTLLVVPPMFPIFKRLKMSNYLLALPLGLAAGIMNAVPWAAPPSVPLLPSAWTLWNFGYPSFPLRYSACSFPPPLYTLWVAAKRSA